MPMPASGRGQGRILLFIEDAADNAVVDWLTVARFDWQQCRTAEEVVLADRDTNVAAIVVDRRKLHEIRGHPAAQPRPRVPLVVLAEPERIRGIDHELRRITAELTHVVVVERPIGELPIITAIRAAASANRPEPDSRARTGETNGHRATPVSERHTDEFLSVLGHELRNPLAAIHSAVQILDLPRSSEQIREQTRALMRRQLEHMIRSLDDLLDASRISRGDIELRTREVELFDVASHSFELVRTSLESRGISTRVEVPSEGLRIAADVDRLARSLAHLVENLVEHADGSLELVFSGRRAVDAACLQVRVTGTPQNPDLDPHVIERAARLDARQSPQLRHFAARRVIELHRGEFSIETDARGRPTGFLVRLPHTQASA